MLTELSKEQWDQVKTYRSELLQAGQVVGPVNRSEAELAVKAVYAERGLVPPSLVIWARSPQEGSVFAGVLNSFKTITGIDQISSPFWGELCVSLRSQIWGQLNDQLIDLVHDKLWNQLRDQLRDQLRGQLRGQLGRQLRSQIKNQIKDQIGDQITRQLYRQLCDQLSAQRTNLWVTIWNQLYEKLKNQIKDQIGDQIVDNLQEKICKSIKNQLNVACYGPHDLYWLGFYQFLKVELGLKSKADPGPQIELAKNCGWWWPFEGAVVLTEHPVSMSLDEEGRLHSETDMAIKYSDGFGLYSWRGVQVPADWILKPSSITPQMALTWPNIEQRRVAAEIVGWDKVLSELGAKEIDVDGDPQIGVLLEVTLPDSGNERFLRVECGTGRTFALPVPPDMKTALEAQCWIHGDVEPSIIRQLEVRT